MTDGEEGVRGKAVCLRYPNLNVCGCTVPCRVTSEVIQLDPVVDGLFVGSLEDAMQTDVLIGNNIKNVVDASYQAYTKSKDLRYLVIKVEDTPFAHISDHFERSNKFIEEALERGEGVLVHCVAGVSRSVSLVMAYLMYKHRIPMVEALQLVQATRSRAQPNSGFLQQLHLYQASLGI